MATKKLRNLPLFDNQMDDTNNSDRLLHLNCQMLVGELSSLMESSSLSDIFAVVYHIRTNTKHYESGAIELIDGFVQMRYSFFVDALDQIVASQSIERAKYYIKRLVKSLTEERTTPLNDINLNRWKEYDDIITDSLWLIERRDSSGAHMADYWGNFIPQIPNQMMRRFTKRGEWVLDAFAGSGTTLIEGQRLGRNTIGIELQPAVAAAARERIAAEPNHHGTLAELVVGDATCLNYADLLHCHGCASVQLVLLHPPYFDIIKFSDDPHDLSNAPSVDAFLAQIERVAQQASTVLDAGRYLVLVIGDKYVRGEWIPLGFLTMQAVQQQGFHLTSIIVKNFEETTGKRTQQQLWRYRALVGGFYIFKHEYIFVFQKRG